MLLNFSAQTIWVAKCPHQFSTVAFGKLFGSSEDSLVTAGEDGIVRIFACPKKSHVKSFPLQLKRSLETKCGPALHVRLKDVTRLSPCDMLVADTRGTVVLFCDGQILNRRGVSGGVTSQIIAMETQETAMGLVNTIIGYDNGELTCFNTFSNVWHLRLGDSSIQNKGNYPSVTCILALPVVTQASGEGGSDYVMVADSRSNLYVIQDGRILRVIRTPAPVTTMTAGRFLDVEDGNASSKNLTQIALGCANGSIWLCVDFLIDPQAPYADVGYPVAHLRGVPARGNHTGGFPADGTGPADLLVCGGEFPALVVLQYGKVICRHDLPSWPVTLCCPTDHLGMVAAESAPQELRHQLLVGCQDSSLHLISFS